MIWCFKAQSHAGFNLVYPENCSKMDYTIWSHYINHLWIIPKPDTKAAKSHTFFHLISPLIATWLPPKLSPAVSCSGQGSVLILIKNIKKDLSLTNLLEPFFFHLDVCLNIQKIPFIQNCLYQCVILAKLLLCTLIFKNWAALIKNDRNSIEIKEADQIMCCIMHYKRAAVHPLPSWHLLL